MNSKQQRYLRLNLMSLFFAGMSFISITLAWFAYSGLVTTSTKIDVKSLLIEFDKNGDPVSSNIVIPLSEIYPGMNTVSETISIKNKGDSNAILSYEISSARILNDYVTPNGELGYVEDQLSNEYPFHINMSLSDTYINANDGTGEFVISVSWPLDSGHDKDDNDWGSFSYEYQQNNPGNPAIEIQINLKASQYIGDNESPDIDYKVGNIVLYNPTLNKLCKSLNEENCIQTYVIDKNNLIGDTEITLLPTVSEFNFEATGNTYESIAEEVLQNYPSARLLKVEDLLPIISKDVLNSIILYPKYSNKIIGNLNYVRREESNLTHTVNNNGIYRFTTIDYMYLATDNCIWLDTDYKDNDHFALTKLDATYSKIYNEKKDTTCKLIPVFKVTKEAKNRVE